MGPPRAKERVRVNTKTGTAFTPVRTVTYEGRLAYAAQEAMAGRPLFEGPLRVEIVIVLPISVSWPAKRRQAALDDREQPTKKPDYDNYAKILDALNGIVWFDDAQIVEGGPIQKFYGAKPMMAVRVSEVTGPRKMPEWAVKHQARDEGVFA